MASANDLTETERSTAKSLRHVGRKLLKCSSVHKLLQLLDVISNLVLPLFFRCTYISLLVFCVMNSAVSSEIDREFPSVGRSFV